MIMVMAMKMISGAMMIIYKQGHTNFEVKFDFSQDLTCVPRIVLEDVSMIVRR